MQWQLWLFFLLGWLMGKEWLVSYTLQPSIGWKRENYCFFMAYHFLILSLLRLSIFFLFPVIPYSHLYLHSSFSPMLHYPIFGLGNEIFALWPMSGCENGMEGGFGKGKRDKKILAQRWLGSIRRSEGVKGLRRARGTLRCYDDGWDIWKDGGSGISYLFFSVYCLLSFCPYLLYVGRWDWLRNGFFRQESLLGSIF